MILLPDDLREALRANAIRHGIALRGGLAEPDFLPVLKLFNPLGAATWLASELAEDGDTLFGLADLGFGCPELGTFSLSEIAAIRLPYGMAIERDLAFETAQLTKAQILSAASAAILAQSSTLNSNLVSSLLGININQ